MKRSPLAGPEPFSLSPLLALMPVGEGVDRLRALSHSLFARLEKVSRLRTEMQGGEDREAQRRLAAEELLLRTTLEWSAEGAAGPRVPASENSEDNG